MAQPGAIAADNEDEDLYEDDNSAGDEDDEAALLRALAMSKDNAGPGESTPAI